jgi:hypothetical protein
MQTMQGYLWPKKRRRRNFLVTFHSGLASIVKRMFEFGRVIRRVAAMSQNVPLLNRILVTAALASVIAALLISQQLGRAAEPPMAKVVRLHAK